MNMCVTSALKCYHHIQSSFFTDSIRVHCLAVCYNNKYLALFYNCYSSNIRVFTLLEMKLTTGGILRDELARMLGVTKSGLQKGFNVELVTFKILKKTLFKYRFITSLLYQFKKMYGLATFCYVIM